MKYNISNELFEAVMGIKVISITINDYIFFEMEDGYKPDYGISVDTFFFKCKEYAYPYGYTILSSADECYLIDREGAGLVFEQTYIDERQAVFDAAEQVRQLVLEKINNEQRN